MNWSKRALGPKTQFAGSSEVEIPGDQHVANVVEGELARVGNLVNGAFKAESDVVKSPAVPARAENGVG